MYYSAVVYGLDSLTDGVGLATSGSLRLAFGWLMSAFSGHLDSRELLFLWDRIIGFDSLEIVAGRSSPFGW